MRHAIVGISDGAGPITDPATLFPGLRSVQPHTDFSSYGSTTEGLSIDPVPVLSVLAGEVVSFPVATRYPRALGHALSQRHVGRRRGGAVRG